MVRILTHPVHKSEYFWKKLFRNRTAIVMSYYVARSSSAMVIMRHKWSIVEATYSDPCAPLARMTNVPHITTRDFWITRRLFEWRHLVKIISKHNIPRNWKEIMFVKLTVPANDQALLYIYEVMTHYLRDLSWAVCSNWYDLLFTKALLAIYVIHNATAMFRIIHYYDASSIAIRLPYSTLSKTSYT